MTALRFVRRTRLPVPAGVAFGWHARPGAFERLNPPFAPARVLERSGRGIESGSRVVLSAPPLSSRWDLEHTDYAEGERFRDVMRAGPFAAWNHLHAFSEDGPRACVLEDAIDFVPPLGPLGALAGGPILAELGRVFRYRHRVTRDDLAMHAAAAERGVRPLRIAITGATGLIGGALADLLTTGGHTVLRLVRREARVGEARWDPESGEVDARALGAVDAVVHLAGESLASRWSAAHRERVMRSRREIARALCERLAALPAPPRAFVTASGVGLYGDRGDELLEESAAPGEGFLAQVVRSWESAPAPLEAAGARVVRVRFGMVLTPAGGALPRMLVPFRLGAGGRFGSGRQWSPWIAHDDALGVLHHALTHEGVSGAVNAVSPGAVRSAEFARTLGRVLRRPALLPAPAFALRLALGRAFADEMLLPSQRAVPAALSRTGYAFRFPALEDALRHLLGRTREEAA